MAGCGLAINLKIRVHVCSYMYMYLWWLLYTVSCYIFYLIMIYFFYQQTSDSVTCCSINQHDTDRTDQMGAR